MATLNHRGIPTVMDYFSERQRSYLVVQYIEGEDLETILSNAKSFLPIDQVIAWAKEICEVLAYLHKLKPDPILLRGFKPSSVVIDRQNHAWVVDYGLAKIFTPNRPSTQIGTEGYGSPESYRGQSSPASDIFGLGATLHHALTLIDPRLYPPFSFAERPILEMNPALPVVLVETVMKALEFDTQDRFPSGEAMLTVLNSLTSLPSAVSSPHIPSTVVTPVVERETLWIFKAEDEIRSTPIYHQGVIYFTSYDCNLYALSAETGRFQWKFTADDEIATSPVIAPEDDLLFFGSKDGHLYAVQSSTGRLVWSYHHPMPIYSSPTIRHGHVFYGCDDGSLNILRQSTGRLAFTYKVNHTIRCKPAITEDRVVFGTQSGEIQCLDLSGKKIWAAHARREVLASPLVHNDLVYIASMDGYLYAFDINSGFVVWRSDLKKPLVSSPSIGKNQIIVGSTDGILHAFNPDTGKKLWEFEATGQITSSSQFYENAIYFGTTNGDLYCLEAEDGIRQWQFGCAGRIIGSPLLVEDKIFIGADYQLYALRI